MSEDYKAPANGKTPLEERISILETDLRAFRSTFGVMAPSVALVFGLLGIALAWNITSEREDLREFRKDIKDDVRVSLGQIADEPDIVLLTDDGHSLDGAIVEPTITRDSRNPSQKSVEFPIIIRNKGKGWTGDEVAIKIYTPREIPGPYSSTDEPGFAFESYWVGTEQTGLSSLAGGFSYGYHLAVFVDALQEIRAGRHGCLVKFYYGHGKVARASFTGLVRTKQ